MKDELTTEQLREMAYQEVLALFENDQAAAGKWMTSAARGLGNHPPISLMGTTGGIEKVRRLVGQLEHGVVP